MAALKDAMDENGKPIKDITGKNVKRINIIADNLVKNAQRGDPEAIKEMANRIDGKPVQAVVGDSDQPLAVEIIRRIIDKGDESETEG